MTTNRNRSKVKGMTLTDYFNLNDAQPFQNSVQLQCLVGDLITKPRDSHGSLNLKLPDLSLTKQHFQGRPQASQSFQKRSSLKGFQLPQTQFHNLNKFHLLTFRQSKLQCKDPQQNRQGTQTQLELKKSSRNQFRSSSIKSYRIQKMKSKQSFNSTKCQELWKHKLCSETYKKDYVGFVPIIEKRHILLENYNSAHKQSQKYLRNPSPISKEEKMAVYAQHMKQNKNIQKKNLIKKKMIEGVSEKTNINSQNTQYQYLTKYNV